ncbi:MAG TPA: SDR family NAD(P)-dependent oxidoreductase [Alphaproteobacteria bacterium]|jgi:NAD(P)-dependent dehydrogenase (short-subunit alcohol dehydrogenase family)|nr:SDR family NAD(P)-dependent oxidoreductase [Alphaproteobacteria bacterium]
MGALDGKTALVTGASRGIGAAIAQRFGAEGATVIVTARTLSGKGSDYGGQALDGSVEDVVKAIEAGGGKAFGVRCDVGDPASRAKAADEVMERFGGLDILVNNATTTAGAGMYDTITPEQYGRVFEVNVQGPLDLIQRFAPGMAKRGAGWILNLTSKAAEHPDGPPYSALFTDGGMILYGAAKAALNRMTSGLAAELSTSKVAVNALAPFSVVWTPGAAASGLERYRSLPMWHEEPVEGMAEAALALCSGDPAQLTGRVVYSTTYLKEIRREIRTLDGRKALGDWKPMID